jgi:sialate O-acetylesterase
MYKAKRLWMMFLAIALQVCVGTAFANVAVQSLFSNGMVLQREMPVPVWGTGAANEKVTVSINGQQATATTGANGAWSAQLPSMTAGGPYTLTIAGTNTITITDVYIGEVWLCSGQSNMDMRVQCTFSGCVLANAAAEIAAANYPLIRSCNVPWAPNKSPQTTVKTSWLVCNPTNVPVYSAAAYFFGREIFKGLGSTVPVGLIHASFGATCIQTWISRADLVANGFSSQVTSYENGSPTYSNTHDPYICFNGQINPLIPFAIRGAIWYQGESVTWGSDTTYRKLQVLLINSWRKLFGQNLTFLITQLANYNSGGGYMPIREAQLQASEMLANTGLAVAIDIGIPTYVHPSDKQDVGLRLGLAALGITYKQNVTYSGPIYDRMVVQGSSLRLYFKHTDGGLQLNSATATGSTAPFEISSDGTTFSTATATIDQDTTVLVSSTTVTSPKQARYCWAANPKASLYNKGTPAALPASPFRTNAPPIIFAVNNLSRPDNAPVRNGFGLSIVGDGVSGLPIKISFRVPGISTENVRLRMFDMQGRLVATLFNGAAGAGVYEVKFNGIDKQGRSCPAGLYACEMAAGEKFSYRKTALLRLR